MAENGHSSPDLDDNTLLLVEALSTRKDLICWAENAVNVYQLIKMVYQSFTPASEIPDQLNELLQRVKQLEKYMTVDIERHIGVKNGREPYYLNRIFVHLQKAKELIESSIKDGKYYLTMKLIRDVDHLTAEFQSTFNEYGFCHILDAVYDIDEATQKLDGVSQKLTKIEGMLSKNDETSNALIELHDAIAITNGIQQAMTEANINRMGKKFNEIEMRILRLENNISNSSINAESEFFMHYIVSQHLLDKNFVRSMYKSDTFDVVNDHMIHPGTRSWVLDRFQRWLHKSTKRMYIVGGREGTGKTALASAICKLHSHSMVASHFFDSSKGQGDQNNQLNYMIQSICSDLCKTVPEYLNWLDDKYSNADLSTRLSESWKSTYNILLKEPFQTLYGSGSSASPHIKRKVIIIDGIDQLNKAEWPDMKSFLNMFVRDLSSSICLFVTVRTDDFGKLIPEIDDDLMEGFRFEDRSWINRHIKDIELYLSSSLGAILSGEDEVDSPFRARADESTLQNTVDELIKNSGGRFDYAITLMESFASEMTKSSGQFLSSLKKALTPVQQQYGAQMGELVSEFQSPYRSYRDREGRSINVRVMRQNVYRMDKTRVALIRGRHHKIRELTTS